MAAPVNIATLKITPELLKNFSKAQCSKTTWQSMQEIETEF